MLKHAELAPDVAVLNCSVLSQLDRAQDLKSVYTTITVNQGFARKTKNVSPIEHFYPVDKPLASAVWNVFNVSPRFHTGGVLDIPVLERHPFTTQTFVPLGASPTLIEYMVVIAADRDGVPDPATLRAYLCHGGQAVTYGANQWHAPMISLKNPMLFLVTNAENGTSDDCEEYFFPNEQLPRVKFSHIDLGTVRGLAKPKL